MKAIEINIKDEEVKRSLEGIIQELNSISEEYKRALDDFFLPLEKISEIEDKYKEKLGRLKAIAKEDPDIREDVGALKILTASEDYESLFNTINERPLFFIKKENFHYFYDAFINKREILPVYIPEYYEDEEQKVLLPEEYSLIDFFDKYSIAETEKNGIIMYKGEGTIKRKRRLYILFSDSYDRWWNWKPTIERGFGSFALLPAGTEIKNAELIKKVPKIYHLNNKMVDGILYRVNKNSEIGTCYDVGLVVNKNLIPIFKQLFTQEEFKNYFREYFNSRSFRLDFVLSLVKLDDIR